MESAPIYANNPAAFADFYAAQGRLVASLARHPELIRAWFAEKPPHRAARIEAVDRSRSWRSSRLNSLRRRELAELLDGMRTGDPAREEALAAWLLGATPVGTYFEIAAAAKPSLRSIDPEADGRLRELISRRDSLFAANYGLAKIAAIRRHGCDFGDCLSAACSGLLDAIDRYVPGERAARFGYFATYWIRYHLSRNFQKHGSLVRIPIHQYRIERMERAPGDPRRPPIEVVSLSSGRGEAAGDPSHIEALLCDPGPAPSEGSQAGEFDERVRDWLNRRMPPAIRVMLAYGHGVGPLAEAARDYLDHLAGGVRDRLRV
ncbi:MAG: hypothetical protein ACREFX_04715 [Opitutaceae bacterium]